MITQENIPYTADEIKAMVKTCEKYNKALDRADTLMKKEGKKLNVIPICKYIFPEFDTVSEDERIRKEILNVFNQLDEGTTICGRNYDYAKWIAWLEKQGEQQGKSVVEAWKDMRLEVYQQASGNRHEPNCSDDSTKMFSLNDIDEIIEKINEQKLDNKVEPKFKVGDFITNDYCLGKVIEITNDAYLLDTGQGIPFSCEHNAHLWTIEDAKDGDVLALISGQCIFLFDGYDKEYCHYSKLTNSFSPNLNYIGFIQHQFVPATKEQRNLLFTKMKEAGYEWDSEKKELKKIEVTSKD